jgi:hypothetical protein
MQLAIALLAAGLDSPELESWAADALIPLDADGLADFMAGLHVVSVLLLNELYEATGEPPAAILQGWRSWRSTSEGHPPPARAAPLPYLRRLPPIRHEVIKQLPALRIQPPPPWYARRPRGTCRVASRPR